MFKTCKRPLFVGECERNNRIHLKKKTTHYVQIWGSGKKELELQGERSPTRNGSSDFCCPQCRRTCPFRTRQRSANVNVRVNLINICNVCRPALQRMQPDRISLERILDLLLCSGVRCIFKEARIFD